MKYYKLIEKKYLENEQSLALVFEHIKTKAKVFVLSNHDDNKTFGIGFRTPPTDDTGVCHILEHCVLNGSKKYRTKEPFMDLVKGSLQTYLNALTFADKTLYPVASRNDKDFKNLTDVYLDAVFNPRVLEDEKIFRQEGWRFDFKDGALSYKGVVYNEMKGSMSSFENQVYKNQNRELFPDTIYKLNSGGNPYEIPKLTYENFIKYYKKYYHPSNSYIYLYGDMDYESYLEYIHNEYLANYEYKKIDSTLHYQKRFKKPKIVDNYLNTAKEPDANESYITYGAIVGDGSNTKDRMISSILANAIIENESSKLRQKLLSLGILDVIYDFSSNNLESVFSIMAKNIDIKNKDLFIRTFEKELKNIINEGIDKEIIMSEINDYKFDIREKEGSSARGVIYFIRAFDSWLYDKSPIDAIDIFEDLEYIEKNLDNGIFEKFIKEKILENSHKAIISHIPKKDLNREKDIQIKEFLDEKLTSLSEKEKENLIIKNREMEKFQNRENTVEEKATIPMLSKNDITTKIQRINREIEQRNGYKFIKHDLPTSGIDYIRVLFDINHIGNKKEILYLSLLTYALTMLDTKNNSYSDMNKLIYLNTGGIALNISQYEDFKTKEINRKLVLSTKVFSENINNATNIILEYINNVLFTNESRIKEIISMISADLEMSLYQSANALMMQRAISNHLEINKYSEYVRGIDFYLFIKELKNINTKEILNNLENIYNKVFSKNNLIINVASDFTNESELLNNLDKIANSFEFKNFKNERFEFTPKVKKEGFSSSADVNYVSYGNILQGNYDSKLIILNNLISTEFLYNEIRAKAGAYGAGVVISDMSTFATYSYRDPNIDNTLSVYNRIPEFLENLNFTENDLLPYIIGGIGRLDPAMTESQKSSYDLALYLSNKDYSIIDDYIANALSLNVEEVKSFANLFEKTLKKPSLAILGNKNVIEENKDKFDEIIEL